MSAQSDIEEQALAAAALVVLSRESRQKRALDPAALDDAMQVVVTCMRELKRIVRRPRKRPGKRPRKRPRKRRSELEWECPACIRGKGVHNHVMGPSRRRQN